MIAYSRRYNYPKINPPCSGYSAVVDAEDLAAFIHALHLSKVVLVGHSGDNAQTGKATFEDYVFNDPHAWHNMSESARQRTLRNAHEWDLMMTTGILFPDIEPPTIRKITAPVLLLSGAKSYPFLGLISED